MIKAFCGVSPQIHPSAFIEESAQVVGDVHIGQESSVWFNAVLRGDVYHIRIGNRTNIQDGTIVHVTRGTHATIVDDEVTIGHNVTLHGCRVERGCLIGMGAIVLDAARIGARSIVAAGALVPPGMQVPPQSLVIGAPAKIKRELTTEELAGLDVYWKNYIEYARLYKNERA